MHRSNQLHFRRLPPAAQRTTLWRLAWTGLAPEQIAIRTGWSVEQVREALHEELTPASPPWGNRADRIAANT